MEKPDSWKRLSSEEVAACRIFSIRRDLCKRERDGEISDFYVIDNSDWVNVIALTGADDIVFIEQFRHGTEEVNLELPGGIIDDGELPEAAARRELLEETGFSSNSWQLIGRSRPNPAIQNNTIYHFLALNCEKTAETNFDQHESMVTRMLSSEAAAKLISEGKVDHSLVAAAFCYFWLWRTADFPNGNYENSTC